MVVVHGGFGSEHSYLLDSIKGLTNEHRFIFYDQRGSLRSPCPLDTVSFRAHILDLETLRSALGVDKIDIFAHSMGTMITAEYMKDYPNHIGKVVLAGALPMAAVLQNNGAARIAGTQTGGDGCGFMNDPEPLTLPHSQLRFRIPNCVRLRADGTDEVAGIRPDLPRLPLHGEDARSRAYRLVFLLNVDLKRSLGNNQQIGSDARTASSFTLSSDKR